MKMTAFRDSLSAAGPPAGLSVYAASLWYDAKGNWEKAHELIQDLTDQNAARIHAYLHRKEGDRWNADYWYNRAARQCPSLSPDEEWQQLIDEFL